MKRNLEELEEKERRELEAELKECTFKPKINSYKPSPAPMDFETRMTNWELKRKGKLTNLKSELDEENGKDANFTPSVSPIRRKNHDQYPAEISDNYTRKKALAKYYDRMTRAKELKMEKEIIIEYMGRPQSKSPIHKGNH